MARSGSVDPERVFGNILDRIAQIERLLRGLAIPGAVVEDIITGVASAFSHNITDLGVHTAFPGGTTDFLRADGVFAPPPGGGGTFASPVESQFGDATSAGTGTDSARANHVHDRHDDAILHWMSVST